MLENFKNISKVESLLLLILSNSYPTLSILTHWSLHSTPGGICIFRSGPNNTIESVDKK